MIDDDSLVRQNSGYFFRYSVISGLFRVTRLIPLSLLREDLQNEGRESPRFQPWDDRPTTKIFLEQNLRQGISLREQWEELAHYFFEKRMCANCK